MSSDLLLGLLLGIIIGLYLDRTLIPELASALARHARRVHVRADGR